MKKLLSILSAVALTLSMAAMPASAAGIAVDSVVYDDSTDTVTVTDAGKDYTSDNIATWSVVDSASSAVASGTSTEVNEANGSFVITDAVNLDGLATDVYTVSFVTVAGDFSSATFVVGNDNQVGVTATVEPTLTFNLDANAIALGTLSTAYSTGSVTFDMATNAASGADVAVGVAGLTDGTNGIGQTDLAGTEAANTYYMISTNASPVFTDTEDGLTTVGGSSVAASQTVHDGSAPESLSNQLVTIGAKVDAVTPAGTYSDTLTFTVTGSF